MFLFEHIDERDISTLEPEANQIFKGIRPLFEQIALDKVDVSKSVITLKDKGFNICLTVIDREYFPIKIELDWHSTGLFWVEDVPLDNDNYIEVDEFILMVKNFLNGLTIVEYYDRKNRLIKKKIYHGIDTENNESKHVGPVLYYRFEILNIILRIKSKYITKKRTYRLR